MLGQLGYYICIPFAWLTRLFYSVTGSYGVAIILFTLVVKLILLPFQLKSKKSMLRMNKFQPKMKEIQEVYPLPHSDRPVFHHPYAPAVFHDHVQRDHRAGAQSGHDPGLYGG